MVFKDGKVLLGLRKNVHGAGEYAWLGGHLEFMESITDCAKREVKEETGIEIINVRFLRFLNFKAQGRHYADIGMVADWLSGEAKVMEPEKCECWSWYDPNNLPQPLFGTLLSYFEALKTGQVFFDN